MTETHNSIEKLVDKLKTYKENAYNLSPLDMAEYLKIKSNLIKEGLYLTDEMIDLPKEQLVKIIEKQLKIDNSANDTKRDYEMLDRILSVDVSLVEKDRINIRQQLLDNTIKVRITQTGKQFTVNWGTSMKVCNITVPSGWEILVNQGLLLDLYDKSFGGVVQSFNSESLIDLVLFISNRYDDMNKIKNIIEIDLEGISDEVFNELDNNAFSYFSNEFEDLDFSLIVILTIFVELIKTERINVEKVKKLIDTLNNKEIWNKFSKYLYESNFLKR